MLDRVMFEIGARVQIASAMQLCVAAHLLEARERAAGPGSALPIRIRDDAWLGGGAIMLPGVPVGAGSVVAAGAMVTRDVPAGALVASYPARVVKALPYQA
jgi:maltose O-acetyltransferase